jgi:hypothetical protein
MAISKELDDELYEEDQTVIEEWGCPLCGTDDGVICLYKDVKTGLVTNAICNKNSLNVKGGMCIVLHLAATSTNAGLYTPK